MIVQNVSSVATGRTDITFTLPTSDLHVAVGALTKAQGQIGFESLQSDDQIGKVSLVGAGMRTHPGVTAKFLSSLADAGINVEMISTSQIRISVVVREDELPAAVAALHSAFELDDPNGAATVYGGSGR